MLANSFSDPTGAPTGPHTRDTNTLRPVSPPGLSIRSRVSAIALAGGLLTMTGCPSAKTAFDSPAPSKRLDAIVDAAAKNDRSSYRQLVDMLGSDDPVERMLAIRALERITHQTLGYRHQDPEWKRLESVNRWEQWLESTESGLTESGTAGDGTRGPQPGGEVATSPDKPGG